MPACEARGARNWGRGACQRSCATLMQGTPSRSERDIRSLDDGTPFLDLGCHKDLEIVWASARSDDSEAIEHFFCLRRLEEGVGGGVELRDDLRGRVRRREQRVQ